MRGFSRVAFVAAVVLLVAGCATDPREPAAPVGDTADLPERAAVADVPFVAQKTYYCGPASLAMVLGWAGADPVPDQDALAERVYTPDRRGSMQQDMLAAVRRAGYLGVVLPARDTPALLTELAAGHPVIVHQDLGGALTTQWHYAVATGYDRGAGTIRLHSGTTADRTRDLADFRQSWGAGDGWALVVLPPGELPAASAHRAVARAATGLERAERYRAAAQAYEAMARRWPDSRVAAIGAANVRHARGDFAGAAGVLTAHLADRPTDAVAWHNLAEAHLARGEAARAAAAASRAVAHGDREASRSLLAEAVGGTAGP